MRDYEQALTLAQGNEDQIDAMFNMAQACVELNEMITEGARLDWGAVDESLLQKARELLVKVDRIQTPEVERVFGTPGASTVTSSSTQPVPVATDDELTTNTSSADGQELVPEPGRIVTPQILIDTLLEIVSIYLELYDPDPDSDATVSATTAAEACSTMTRALSWRATIDDAASDPEQNLSLALTRLQLASTLRPEHRAPTFSLSDEDVIKQYEELVSAPSGSLTGTGNNNVDLLSTYADFLLDRLFSTPQSSPTAQAQLERAADLYARAHNVLTDRFTPLPYPSAQRPPRHVLSGLLCANATSRAQAELLRMYHGTPAVEALRRASDLVIQAINGTATSAMIQVSSDNGSQRLEVVLTATNGGAPLSWRTLVTLRDAWFFLVRLFLYSDLVAALDSTADAAGASLAALTGGQDFQTAQQLVHAWSTVSDRDSIADLRWYVDEECKDDILWERSQGTEAQGWSNLVAALSAAS